LIVSCIFIFIGFEGIAFAPVPSLLKVCVFFFGLGGGAINGATNAVVADISLEHKGAQLSALGVSFGIGALGMPVILGLLKDKFSFETILGLVGVFTLLVAIFFAFIRFPAAKQKQGFPIRQAFLFLKDQLLLLIAFFLFCQSSFEAIINNWTTSFLVTQYAIEASDALFGLSLFVAGLTVMRLLTGTVFRKIDGFTIMFISFGLIFLGLVLLKIGISPAIAMTGLVLLGAGLSGGFPIMLGIVGNLYTKLSGTAFSFVLVIALVGNMLVNYGMGIIAKQFGIGQVINVAFVELLIMIVLCLFIRAKFKNQRYVSKAMA
jgi:fucose permease